MSEDPLVVTISSSSSINPDEMSRKTFPAVKRGGVDADAVRRYLEVVAAEVRALHEREADLRRRLADAERRAAEPEIDEATLTKAVGTETARILQTAHDAARDVVERAEAQVSAILSEAEQAAETRTAEAEETAREVIAAAEHEAATLTEAALAEAAAEREAAAGEAAELTDTARADAEALLEVTKDECRSMVHEARQLRTSVLQDLNERRKALFVQLEQLRSGRDSLVEVVEAVGVVTDELRERLASAEHEARVAAAEAGERAAADRGWDEIDEELEAERRALAEETEAAEDREIEAAALEEAAPSGELSEEALVLELAVDEGLAGELGDAAEPGGSSGRSVDELFAMIRASREAAEAEAAAAADLSEAAGGHAAADGDVVAAEGAAAEGAAAEGAPDEAAGAPAPEPEPEGVLGAASAHEAAVNEADEDLHAGLGEADGGSEAATTAEGAAGADMDADESAEGDPDQAALARRGRLLSPIETRLARAVKRALQDDQNELLDAIRHTSGSPDIDALLPEDQQRKRFEEAVSALLGEAWAAGRGWLGTNGAADEGAVGDAGSALAGELAKELSAQLRHRLSGSFEGAGDASESSTQDLASAAYRDWKGARVEGLAGDFANQAFSGGAVSGGHGVVVRWVVDDEGQSCPDCDDNSLAGPQPVGEAFPTGQLHPPVHPGCRCLLVAADS